MTTRMAPTARTRGHRQYHQVLQSESKRPAEPKRWQRHAGQVSYAVAFKACRAPSPPKMQEAQLVQPCRGQACCVFCSAAAFRTAAASPRPKILQMLKKLQALDSSNVQKVLDRIRTWEGEDAAARYEVRFAQAPRKRRCLTERRAGIVVWLDARSSSRRTSSSPRPQSRRPPKSRRSRHFVAPAAATNDTGLPFPKDAMARRVEAWCKHGSWAMCQSCGSMQPRPLQPVDLRRLASPTISEKACTACRHGEYVPQPDDIPQQLRHLKPKFLRALRPLDIDTGTFQRTQYGYRIHSSMVTFAWASQPVEDKIAALKKRKDRASARAALEYLLGSDASSYKSFYDRHHAYLQRHGSEMPDCRCAFWRRKVWKARSGRTCTSGGISAKPWPGHLTRAASSASADELEEPWTRTPAGSRMARTTRLAILALAAGLDGSSGFLRKVLSPVVGAEYDLLHFVYDLSLWTTIGTKKNVARQFDIPIRLVLSGCPWSILANSPFGSA